MKRFALIAFSVLLASVVMQASSHLSASSRMLIGQRRAKTASWSGNDYQAFISINNKSSIDSLSQLGVIVEGVFDGFVTARIPQHALLDVSAMPGVTQLSLGRRVTLCNDSARHYSGVDAVHRAVGRVAPLDGTGVIVGMIDTGFDFNHINLCDEYGHSRVRAVYLPCDSTGTAPIVDGNPLPGSCFETDGQIAALTSDVFNSSHGTHTTGTAAGSYMPNGWYGVAPRADIVACGMPEEELTDVNIAHCVLYIMDYADRVGKPCVINMSLGSNDGPNDGTSYLCKTFESVSGPGRICVLSAGNDGALPICFHQKLTGVGDTVTTLLRNRWGGLQRKGFVSMWNDIPQEQRSRIVIINRNTLELEYASPFVGGLPEDSIFTIDSQVDPGFASYYTGRMSFASAVEQLPGDTSLVEGRFHSYWMFDVTAIGPGHLVGIQYVADDIVNLSGWCTANTYFYSFGLPGITGGSASGSISDLATTDSVISVGAYSTRATYAGLDGAINTVSQSIPTDIAYFSSFGPDERGISRPDLCAPGNAVLSSANRYDVEATRNNWTTPVEVHGITYPYYANQGTSMSAPVVSGTIALMLQVNPELTPSMVREALKATSLKDSFVLNGEAERWGSGKLDAAAAVDYVVTNTLLAGDVNNDGEVTVADVQVLTDIVLDVSVRYDAATLLRADINRDSEIQLADINCLIDLILK